MIVCNLLEIKCRLSTIQGNGVNIISKQAKAYEQATKRMNERILELTSYVNAMKKTNKSDNFVPSSSSSQLI